MGEVELGERDGKRRDVDSGYVKTLQRGGGAAQVRVEKKGYAACSGAEIQNS